MQIVDPYNYVWTTIYILSLPSGDFEQPFVPVDEVEIEVSG